jgi:hypothetical protein
MALQNTEAASESAGVVFRSFNHLSNYFPLGACTFHTADAYKVRGAEKRGKIDADETRLGES